MESFDLTITFHFLFFLSSTISSLSFPHVVRIKSLRALGDSRDFRGFFTSVEYDSGVEGYFVVTAVGHNIGACFRRSVTLSNFLHIWFNLVVLQAPTALALSGTL